MLKAIILLLLLADLEIRAEEASLSAPVTPAPAMEKSLGKILVYNGSIEIFSRGFKTAIAEGMLPLSIYPGDEIKVALASNCQVLLDNNDILNLAPETHLAVDWFNKDSLKFFLKFGSFMLKTNQDTYLKTRGAFAKISSGNYVFKYNKVRLQTTAFNINGEVFIKHENSGKVYKVKGSSYLSMFYFSKEISNGNIDADGIKRLARLFEVSYRPDGKIVKDKKIPGSDLREARVPFSNAINLDYAKRQSGI